MMKLFSAIKNRMTKKEKEKKYPKCCDMEIKRQRFDMFVEHIDELHKMLLSTCDSDKPVDKDLLLDMIDNVDIACFDLRRYYDLDDSYESTKKHNRKVNRLRKEEEENGYYISRFQL